MLFLLLALVYSHMPCSHSTLHTEINGLESSVYGCRSERQVYLPPEVFRADACARCYMYMPYNSFKVKFRYDPISNALLDPRTNVTYVADPYNASSALLGSILDDNLVSKWRACCEAAWDCCEEMIQRSPSARGGAAYCPLTWDGWQCWPETEAGTKAAMSCQDHIYFQTDPPSCRKYASKECLPNGTWYLSANLREWTNYSKCGRRDVRKFFSTSEKHLLPRRHAQHFHRHHRSCHRHIRGLQATAGAPHLHAQEPVAVSSAQRPGGRGLQVVGHSPRTPQAPPTPSQHPGSERGQCDGRGRPAARCCLS